MPHRAPTPGPKPRRAGRLPGRACSATHTPNPRLGQPHTLRMVLREYNSDFLVSIERGQALPTRLYLPWHYLPWLHLPCTLLWRLHRAWPRALSLIRRLGHYPSSDA